MTATMDSLTAATPRDQSSGDHKRRAGNRAEYESDRVVHFKRNNKVKCACRVGKGKKK
jgi:hypothetical protein